MKFQRRACRSPWAVSRHPLGVSGQWSSPGIPRSENAVSPGFLTPTLEVESASLMTNPVTPSVSCPSGPTTTPLPVQRRVPGCPWLGRGREPPESECKVELKRPGVLREEATSCGNLGEQGDGGEVASGLGKQ